MGCCGRGKTTLAKELASKLKLPLIHLDVLNWRDNWSSISKEEFDDLLLEELQKDKWIIDGNNNRTLPLRLQSCDTVIFLDYPRRTCLFEIIKRMLKGYGKTRSDMRGNCPEQFDLDFLKFVWNFNKNNRKECSEFLQRLSRSSTG